MEIAQVFWSGSDAKLVLVFRLDPITGKIKAVQKLKELPSEVPSHRIRRREYHNLLRKHLPRKVKTKEQRREAHRKSVAEYRKRQKHELN